jgi:hypothetical protein
MKAASAALLLIVAVRGVSARAEASKIMRQKAVEICENTSAFLDSRNSCLKAIAANSPLAGSIGRVSTWSFMGTQALTVTSPLFS